MIDVGIIGAGPAGLSAAINVVARNRKPVVFGRKKESSWLYKAERVNNHLGMGGMSGEEMIRAFYAHAAKFDIEIKEGRVMQVFPMGDGASGGYFAVNFENDIYEAKSIIIATGIVKPGVVKGENELLGKGVSYCATCDGMLYRNKEVVVVGEIEEGEDDANFLSEICKKVVYVYQYDNPVHINDSVLQKKGKVSAVFGNEFVTGVQVGEENIPCEGVFFIKESMPLSNLIDGLETEDNAIKVNKYMETSLKGVYAAGDCTGWPYQVSNAIGEGLVAAQQCVKFLNS